MRLIAENEPPVAHQYAFDGLGPDGWSATKEVGKSDARFRHDG